MTSIAPLTADELLSKGDVWATIAKRAVGWATRESVALRDAVVLVPFAQLLPPARAAFARAVPWMPRVETTGTLALALGPEPPAEAGRLNFDPVLDALTAEALLRGERWSAAWAAGDPRGFENGVRRLASTAAQIARALQVEGPGTADRKLAVGRALLPPLGAVPGARERALARIALEWAALAAPPASARLHGLRPSGWIVVRAGGADPLAEALAASGAAPALVIDADAAVDARPPSAAIGVPTLAVCADFEDEAQRTAAQVLRNVERRETPVALIAQDRLLIRRVRALLERHAIAVRDETGWKLSTTRAAAEVMGLLRAAAPGASTDALYAWLKTAARDDAATVDALEAACRRGGIRTVAAFASSTRFEPAPGRLRDAVVALFEPLAADGRRPLGARLEALAGALRGSGAFDRLAADAAGRQVLAVLRLDRPAAPAWHDTLAVAPMTTAAFVAWVDRVLEDATFLPALDAEAEPEVVIVPLAGTTLRPFAAAVLPGADDRHLGAPPPAASLLRDAEATVLGVPTTAMRRRAEALAFGHLLALPKLALLHRRSDGAEPVLPSPLVERLDAALLAAAGRGLVPAPALLGTVEVAVRASRRPSPAAAGRLPGSLSASACEALRACPYRFHSRHVLGLRDADELDGELEKRDYGNWLHEVLHRFHRDRAAVPSDRAGDLVALHAAARAAQQAKGLPDADFLPYAASFRHFAPLYLDWLAERDAAGACWQQGEVRFDKVFDDLALHGVIDRIDAVDSPAGIRLELFDYKTGSDKALTEKVREPFEDTQLALYAALVAATTGAKLDAAYLPMDARKDFAPIAHRNVGRSADALVAGLQHDLRRLRAGAGLPALGEGATCEHCEARGVCRRDDWSDVALPAAAAAAG